jgi:hypothetical protein
MTWTHYSIRYEVTWDKTLASTRTHGRVRANASMSDEHEHVRRTRLCIHADMIVSARTGSVHAMDAKGFGETT